MRGSVICRSYEIELMQEDWCKNHPGSGVCILLEKRRGIGHNGSKSDLNGGPSATTATPLDYHHHPHPHSPTPPPPPSGAEIKAMHDLWCAPEAGRALAEPCVHRERLEKKEAGVGTLGLAELMPKVRLSVRPSIRLSVITLQYFFLEYLVLV